MTAKFKITIYAIAIGFAAVLAAGTAKFIYINILYDRAISRFLENAKTCVVVDLNVIENFSSVGIGDMQWAERCIVRIRELDYSILIPANCENDVLLRQKQGTEYEVASTGGVHVLYLSWILPTYEERYDASYFDLDDALVNFLCPHSKARIQAEFWAEPSRQHDIIYEAVRFGHVDSILNAYDTSCDRLVAARACDRYVKKNSARLYHFNEKTDTHYIIVVSKNDDFATIRLHLYRNGGKLYSICDIQFDTHLSVVDLASEVSLVRDLGSNSAVHCLNSN